MERELQHQDGLIDLGAAEVETRGILLAGKEDVENDRAFLNGGIVADD